ncbi:MAG: flagellar modification protein B [Gammaproteobacteria bacterium RIFCSPHIGHO2_02_FULL_39_13]|nr:MAG: flagellar modification protein B [Gammaproteobacteria bacterium RIFCSPHIGHO2_02_FULL_39_13]OGT48534.1 MAG: flagellar modification protein B [Gammaproteobacteria bacterium RIFCSPHIGHO2_12_FULL_39_24]
MNRLCTICARGGSKGVTNKNIIDIAGKPLIAHTIIQAKKSELFDYIAVSSDSSEIREVAMKWGADFTITRPQELASDTAAKIPAIQHAVNTAEKKLNGGKSYDIIVDLDATSPLRIVLDIKNAVMEFESNNEAMNLISITKAHRSPYFNMVEVYNGYAKLIKPLSDTIIRRQDTPACYDMNASIYIWRRDTLFQNQSVLTNKTMTYFMPEERSIDIDTEFDLKIVRFLAESRMDMQE